MPASSTILIVEDDANFRSLERDLLEDEHYRVLEADSGEEALSILQNESSIDLMLLDLRLPQMDGISVLKETLKIRPDLAVVLISGHGDIESAVKAVRLGAYDFLEKPVQSGRLLLTVERALSYVNLQRERQQLLENIRQRYQLVSVSQAMEKILSIVDRVAETDVTVLITGESGTGKEMVARAIHLNSRRASGPFVQLNCAALPDNLIESELFGHVKGAFTGALHSHAGRFQQADKGTLFLDEIGDLSLLAQSKVLRAIETSEVNRVGSEKHERVDVRIIAATNRDLKQMVEEKTFREDLYHRINVISLYIPPLRERQEDILPLAEHFLREFADQYNREPPKISTDAESVLLSYHWPGNVRELRNLMQKIMVLGDALEIHGHDISELLGKQAEQSKWPRTPTLREARKLFEKSYILNRLEANGWNISQTAKLLGVERSNLYKIMDQLGIRGKEKKKK